MAEIVMSEADMPSVVSHWAQNHNENPPLPSYTPLDAVEILTYIFQNPPMFIMERHSQIFRPPVYNGAPHADQEVRAARIEDAKQAWDWWSGTLTPCLANSIASTALQHVRYKLENHWMWPMKQLVDAMHKLCDVFALGLISRCEQEELTGFARQSAISQLRAFRSPVNQPTKCSMSTSQVISQSSLEVKARELEKRLDKPAPKANEVSVLATKVKNQRSELSKMIKTAADEAKAKEVLRKQVAAKDGQISRLQNQYLQATETLTNTITAKDGEIGLLSKQLGEARDALKNTKTAKDRESGFSEKQLTEAVQALTNTIAGINGEINLLTKQLAEARASLSETTTAKDGMIDVLTKQLAEVKDLLSYVVTTRDGEIHVLTKQVAEASEILASTVTIKDDLQTQLNIALQEFQDRESAAVTATEPFSSRALAQKWKRARDSSEDDELPVVKRQRKNWLLAELW